MQILEALADDLMEYGDLRWAMRNLMSRGMQMPQGGYMQGLRDMLKQLRDRKTPAPRAVRPLQHLRRLQASASTRSSAWRRTRSTSG